MQLDAFVGSSLVPLFFLISLRRSGGQQRSLHLSKKKQRNSDRKSKKFKGNWQGENKERSKRVTKPRLVQPKLLSQMTKRYQKLTILVVVTCGNAFVVVNVQVDSILNTNFQIFPRSPFTTDILGRNFLIGIKKLMIVMTFLSITSI